MDAKAKIAEMLRQKREGNSSTKQTIACSDPSATTESNRSIPPPPPITSNNFVKSDDRHATSIDRINAMLRQRQQSESKPSTVTVTATPLNNITSDVSQTVSEKIDRCQFCLGRLVIKEGIFHCDKCQRRFIKQSSNNEFLNISELPLGICDCCQLRAPLIKLPGTIFPQCANSKETYVPAAGRAVRLRMLPFGLCRCCNKPEILMATQDQSIRCPASGTEYVRNVDGSIAPKPPVVEIPSTNDIEAALNDGNAAFYYGGFIGGQQQNTRRRRRR
jgi:hypothetical protein